MDAKREKALAEAREKSSHSGDLTRESPLDHIIKGLLMVSREDDLLYRIGRIYRQFDADQSGGLSLDEMNAGLRQFGLPSDRKPQLTGEDWDAVTERGRLLDSNGELSIKGFENMMLHQIRVYTHKKLVQSMMQLDGDESQESQMTTYLLLKSVMMTSHQASRMLARIGKVVDPGADDDHHELSKKERIQRLQRMWAPLYKYFATWKEAAGGEGADGDAGASGAVGQELVLARLDNVEAKVSVVCDKLSGVEDSIQQLSRLLLNSTAVQLPGGQDRNAGGDGADGGARDVSVRREVKNEAQQQEMETTSDSKTSQSPARPLSPPAMISQQMFESGHGNSVVTISTTMAQDVDAEEGMADDKTTSVVTSSRRAIASAADWYGSPASSPPPPISSSPSGNGNVQRFTHPNPIDDRASPASAQAATARGAVHSGAFTPVQESEAKDAERLANMGIAAPKTFTKPNPAIEDSTGQPMSSIELMLQASEIPGSG